MVKRSDFQTEIDGKSVDLVTLKNSNGMTMQVTNYGAKVVTLELLDRARNSVDVVLGFDTIYDYLKTSEIYFGSVIGRVGNRIAKSCFSIDNQEYKVVKNIGENHLHGGIKGFNAVVWDFEEVTERSVTLSYLSPHLEEGFPGNLQVFMTYMLTKENGFRIEYRATTDQPTPVALTHHSFFNLNGAGEGEVTDHLLQIFATTFTPVHSDSIPTGEVESLIGTPLDFTDEQCIGDRIESTWEQIQYGFGYDHNYVFPKREEALPLVAKARSPKNGIVMSLFADTPGMQLYTGNAMDGSVFGKGGKQYLRRGAFCLEPQTFPNSINEPKFEDVILRPGAVYKQTTIYQFSVE